MDGNLLGISVKMNGNKLYSVSREKIEVCVLATYCPPDFNTTPICRLPFPLSYRVRDGFFFSNR